jgi:hypothetical protein
MWSGETITMVGAKADGYDTHLCALYLCSKWMTSADVKRGATDIVNLSSVCSLATYERYEGDLTYQNNNFQLIIIFSSFIHALAVFSSGHNNSLVPLPRM